MKAGTEEGWFGWVHGFDLWQLTEFAVNSRQFIASENYFFVNIAKFRTIERFAIKEGASQDSGLPHTFNPSVSIYSAPVEGFAPCLNAYK